MKKSGRKQLSAEEKRKRQISKLEKGNLLDLRVLEQLNLLNNEFPISKQIFIKKFSLKFRQKKNYRYVKIKQKHFLIDCRAKQNVLKDKDYQIANEKDVVQGQIEKQKPPDNPPMDSVIYISTTPARQHVQEQKNIQEEIDSDSFVSSDSELQQQSKTQLQKVPQFNYLRYQSPNESSFSSINFSQALSSGFANELMQDSFAHNIDSNILNNSFFQPDVIQSSFQAQPQENQYQKTLQMLRQNFDDIQINEYEKLLSAYSYDHGVIQKIITTNYAQIGALLDKYKRKKIKN